MVTSLTWAVIGFSPRSTKAYTTGLESCGQRLLWFDCECLGAGIMSDSVFVLFPLPGLHLFIYSTAVY